MAKKELLPAVRDRDQQGLEIALAVAPTPPVRTAD